MSLTVSATRIDLELRPSRQLLGLLAVLHGLALYALWLTPLPAMLRAALLLLLLGGIGRSLWRLHGPAAVRRLWGRLDGPLLLQQADGRRLRVRLRPGAFESGMLLLVHLDSGDRWPRPLPILPDMLAADDYRRLRRELRRLWPAAG
ncbi:hypothetical protein QVG61_06600 [Thiohalobacter sp. IOR34]|uniref:protein YgfX n=1 Tax=Thiohalobacter sp. IOR34 TaxID=3057176 RepID=UPI0025B083B6|nr:protein YgfX [Thiohalobacter sp. IOR34]WJW76748.1 hypothetical protein QVG61_06600 [Thiohalobacter sp. IOR34]